MTSLLLPFLALILIGAAYWTVDDFFQVHKTYDDIYTAAHKAMSVSELDRVERDFKFFKSKHTRWPSHRQRAKDIHYFINMKKEDLKRYTQK